MSQVSSVCPIGRGSCGATQVTYWDKNYFSAVICPHMFLDCSWTEARYIHVIYTCTCGTGKFNFLVAQWKVFLLTRIIVERHIISDRCSHSVCTRSKRQVGSGHGGAECLWLLLLLVISEVDGGSSVESGAVHVGRVALGRWLEIQRDMANGDS